MADATNTQESSQKTGISKRPPGWLAGLVLILASVAVYYPALHGEFVFDDNIWLNEWKPLLQDTGGLWRMWTDPNCLYQYYPLTHTTHWLDFRWWGGWTLPHHLANVLLHGLSAVVFWRLLLRLQVPGAWLAAAIFALHPIMAESVAWISERKNVLSQLFYLGAVLQYGRCTEFWSEDARAPRRGAWVLAFLLFLGALLSKITAFSLPPALLLICWWKRGRIRWKEDVQPVLPFFALALMFGVISTWMEKHSSGAQGEDWDLPWQYRVLVAGRALAFYVGKLAWPASLTPVYPRWELDPSEWSQWLFPVIAVAGVLGLWLARKRVGRGPLAAIAFFILALLPLLGFLDVSGMLYCFVADRWVYSPSLALIALAAAGMTRAAARLRQPVAGRAMACLLLATLAMLTWRQAAIYQDGLTLWRIVTERSPGAWMAYINLGMILSDSQRQDEAIANYRKALQIRPNHALAETNMGLAYQRKGDLESAEAHYKAALAIKPDEPRTHQLYALLLMEMGRGGEALVHNYWHLTRLDLKRGPGPLIRLAWTLATSPDAKMRSGRHAVELAERIDEFFGHRSAEALQVLAAAYAEAGRFQEAAETAQRGAAFAGDTPLGRAIGAQRQLYLENKPFRVASAPLDALRPPAP